MVDIVSQTDACGNGGAGSSDFQLVVQNHGPVVPQLGAYINKKYGPGQGAQYGKDDEFRQRELGDTGRKGNKGAHPRQQAAGENGNGTIIFKPILGGNHLSGTKASFGGVLQNHVAPSSGAHIVGYHGPRNTGGGSDDDCRPEGENILGNKKTGKAQNDFTGDRDIHIFQHHADEKSQISPFREK